MVNAKSEYNAEDIVEKLTQTDSQSGEFLLNGVVIKGKMDLKHRIIPVAVTLTNCIFTDEVDMEYCEFKQCVDFSRSRFEKRFNSCGTIYWKDLRCDEVVFENETVFNSAKCEGSGYFVGTLFENPDAEVSFLSAEFGDLIFGGDLLFNIDLRFQNDLDKNSIRMDLKWAFENRRIQLSDTAKISIEEENSNWLIIDDVSKHTYSIIKDQSKLNVYRLAAVFKGGASFNGFQCKGKGIFRNTRFENKERDVNFVGARFGLLDCTSAVFNSGASFNRLWCERDGFFRNAQFKSDRTIDFVGAKFDYLECTDALFKGKVSFNSLRCEGTGYFRETQFVNEKATIDFTFVRFGRSVEFRNATFAGPVHFGYAHISGKVVLLGTKFQNNVSFNCTTMNNLSITNHEIEDGSDHFPFDEKKDIDFRQCTFDVFEGTKTQQRRLVSAQSPIRFSQDPYLQFERYYQSIGDESYARKVYYAGRLALRKNALCKYKHQNCNPEIQWSFWKVISDWALRWTVGYGVKIWRTFLLIFTFLCIGTGVFWSDEALVIKKSENISTENLTINQTGKINETKQSVDICNFFNHLGHRLWYSLDLLLPVVDLEVAKEYQRPVGWRAPYAVIHIIMGWILVPLLIASLSGVIKK